MNEDNGRKKERRELDDRGRKKEVSLTKCLEMF